MDILDLCLSKEFQKTLEIHRLQSILSLEGWNSWDSDRTNYTTQWLNTNKREQINHFPKLGLSTASPWPLFSSVQFSSVHLLSRVWLFATPWIAAHQASLSITNPQSSPKLLSIESVMPSSHLILCRPLLPLPPIPPSIRVFSNESTLRESTLRMAKVLEFQL